MSAEHTATCPQCGGVNTPPSGTRVMKCTFCDAALFVDRTGVVLRYSVARSLDQRHALEALARWMAGNDTVKDLDRKAKVESFQPISFPLWFFRLPAGRQGEDVRVEPAAATTFAELAEVQVPAAKLEPYRSEGEGVEEIAATVPLETARGWLGGQATNETALVQVPLWRCQYRYDGELYPALVDASTGAVLANIYPSKSESPFYLTAAVSLIVFLAEGFLVSNPFFKVALYAVTSVPLLGLAFWVSRKV